MGYAPRPRRDCQHPRANHQHGTKLAYDADRCGCLPCRLASHHAEARYWRTGTAAEAASWAPRIGVVRRLQALRAIGYTDENLGRYLGVNRQAMLDLRRYSSPRVMASTAARIADMYETLSAHPQTGTSAARSRRTAESRGWPPPLAWDDETIDDPDAAPAVTVDDPDALDEVAVERAMHGDPPATLGKPERLEAIRLLAELGYNDVEIGDRVGITDDAVLKLRGRNKIPAGRAAERVA